MILNFSMSSKVILEGMKLVSSSCNHGFLILVYAADMPKRLPFYDIASGLLKSVAKALKYWFHYTLVAIAWLGVVPLTACKYLIFFYFKP